MSMYKEPMTYDDLGRRSIHRRMELLYGTDVYVLKGKACLQTSVQNLIGYVLQPADQDLLFGEALYEDWAGSPNRLDVQAQLIAVEVNKASCYLVFKQLS
jgi:hypothetical protein